MKKFIPIALFVITFILVIHGANQFITGSESIDWLDIPSKALFLSAGIAAFVVILYKILMAKIKMALLLIIIAAAIILFNLFLKF